MALLVSKIQSMTIVMAIPCFGYLVHFSKVITCKVPGILRSGHTRAFPAHSDGDTGINSTNFQVIELVFVLLSSTDRCISVFEVLSMLFFRDLSESKLSKFIPIHNIQCCDWPIRRNILL